MPRYVKTCQFPVLMSGHRANLSQVKQLGLGLGLNLDVDTKNKMCGLQKAKNLRLVFWERAHEQTPSYQTFAYFSMCVCAHMLNHKILRTLVYIKVE
jgi:hypothetical protein